MDNLVFNYIYSLLESAKYNVILGRDDFNVRLELSLLVVIIEDNVLTFEMYNGKIRTIWLDGETCVLEDNMYNKILKLMKT